MSVFNFFRNVFGYSNNIPQEGMPNRHDDGGYNENPNEFRNPIWNLDEDDDDDDFRHTPNGHFGFNVDSDPIGIHRFFEQQMDEMLKRFGLFGLFSGAGQLPAPEDSWSMNPGQGPSGQQSLRDEMLKPGYDMERSIGQRKMDSDLDDRISAGGLSSILQQKPSLEPDVFSGTSTALPGFSSMILGRSVMSKTVRRADGSVEHHRTVRDSEGNEETTITRQVGDQSYTVTTQKAASGEEKCTKNIVNISEENLQEFEKKFGIKF